MSLISVIVPVYKVEPYIQRCVDSILAQTFTDFELILVDDGSPDNCGAICDEYASKDSRIHVIHQKNGGLSAARNAGIDWAIANSDSQWLSFIDSDDWVHPCFLEYLYRAVQETGMKVSVCLFERVECEKPFAGFQFHVTQEEWDVFYMNDWAVGVVAWNKLYKKELFSELRYPVGRIHEDEFLTYRLLEKAATLACVDLNLYYYFQNPAGIMKRDFSLRNLDVAIALKNQCRFAKKKGFRDFYLNRLTARFDSIRYLLRRCSKATSLPVKTKKKGLHYLRRELRFILLFEGRNIASNNTKRTSYQEAFPTLSRIYNTIRRITRKLCQLVSRHARN